MSDINRPRCECCDEVLEELLTMRQNFEKLCQRLGNQIVELRREVRGMAALNPHNQTTTTATNNSKDEGKKPKQRRKSRSYSQESSSSPPPRKTTRRQRGESPDFVASGGGDSASNAKIQVQHADTIKLGGIKQEATSAASSSSPATTSALNASVAKSQARARRPVLEFFGIRARVMPTRPFAKSAEFEDWEALLQSDEDQRDQLRVELLAANYDLPDKFIKQTWRSILSDEATMHYTYHGNAKTVKKAVKNYTFTAIFQEAFVQLFERLDSSYFMERTMRFFNYCHDRTRRINRLNQTRDMESTETIQFETSNVDDQTQTIDDDEDEVYREIFVE